MTRDRMTRRDLVQCGLTLSTGIVLSIRTAQAEATPTGEGIRTCCSMLRTCSRISLDGAPVASPTATYRAAVSHWKQRIERGQSRGCQHAKPSPLEECAPLPLRCDVLHCYPTLPSSASPRAASMCSSSYCPISKAHTMWGSYPAMACILLYTGEFPHCRGVETGEVRRAFSDNCGSYSDVSTKNGVCIALTTSRTPRKKTVKR
jgi:hypothetical protein